MKSRPIIYSGPMVRALLRDIDPKTQTRRTRGLKAINADPNNYSFQHLKAYTEGLHAVFLDHLTQQLIRIKCPYGEPGDQLWVKENIRAKEREDGYDGVLYEADQAWVMIDNTKEAADNWLELFYYDEKRRGRGSMVPSIHMPRWASRLTHEITAIRLERVNDISASDAIAEGCIRRGDDDYIFHSGQIDAKGRGLSLPVTAYALLWDEINGPESYDQNPWVWAIEFKAVQP